MLRVALMRTKAGMPRPDRAGLAMEGNLETEQRKKL